MRRLAILLLRAASPPPPPRRLRPRGLVRQLLDGLRGRREPLTGLDQGLLGHQVGSRVLLVIPPAEGYGKSGNPQAGIKGDDTLVFVVDVLGSR